MRRYHLTLILIKSHLVPNPNGDIPFFCISYICFWCQHYVYRMLWKSLDYVQSYCDSPESRVSGWKRNYKCILPSLSDCSRLKFLTKYSKQKLNFNSLGKNRSIVSEIGILIYKRNTCEVPKHHHHKQKFSETIQVVYCKDINRFVP